MAVGGGIRRGVAVPDGAVSLIKPPVQLAAVDEGDLADIAEAKREQLRRREADAELVADLRCSGFVGKRYRRFEDELIDYALEVFQAWLATGHIFTLCAARGHNLRPSDAEFELLRNPDHRADVASMAVAKALRTFKERALIGGRWSPEGGATLTTYFMGATVYAYWNVLRDERAARSRERKNREASEQIHNRSRHTASDSVLDSDAVEYTLDPAFTVVGRATLDEALAGVSDRERLVLRLHLAGYTHDEIAEILGDKTGRSIEGVLYRWRKREQARRSLRGWCES